MNNLQCLSFYAIQYVSRVTKMINLVYMHWVILDDALSLQHLISFFHLRLVRQQLTPAIQQLNALETYSVRHLTAHVLYRIQINRRHNNKDYICMLPALGCELTRHEGIQSKHLMNNQGTPYTEM